MNHEQDRILHILKKIPLFAQASEETLLRVSRGAALKKLLPREVYKTAFQRCSDVSYVVTGTLSIQGSYEEDQVLVMRHVRSGETFGEIIAFSREYYPGWLTALAQTELLEIHRTAVIDACQDTQVLIKLLEDISEKAVYLSKRIHLLSGNSVETRLKRWLREQYRQQGRSDLIIQVSVTSLAHQLAASRETLSRLFSRLHKEGRIVREGTKLTILDIQWLEEDSELRIKAAGRSSYSK